MIQKLAFSIITVIGAIVAAPNMPAYGGVIAQAASTPTPPAFIPAWVLGGGAFYGGQQATAMPTASFNDVDPGATPDQRLFAGVLDASETTDDELKTNCPGLNSGGSNLSKCNPYKYVNMLLLVCGGTLKSTDAFNYLNSNDETGFLHQYAGAATPTPTPGNRLTSSGSCASPTPTPGTNNGFYTNPDDAAFHSWLLSNVFSTPETNFPPPYGIYEDHFAVDGGGGACYYSQEYGGRACNKRGNSGSPDPHDWETALGDFENNAETYCVAGGGTCFPFVGNGLTPGGGGTTPPCTNTPPPPGSATYCFATPEAGVVNDMDALDNVCAAADSFANLEGITAEQIVFLKGNTATGTPAYANSQTIVYMINTMSHLVNYTSGGCKNTVAIDVEAPGGSFYPLNNYTPGTVAGGLPVRMEATALRFLVPNPETLIPDRMQPFYYTIGGTNNNWSPSNPTSCSISPYCEVPYMFEETLVPQGPERTVGAFAWNGSSATVGDGCPTPNPGDTGGAVDLVATCVPTDLDPGSAVFLQEYKHLYIAGNDYGPVAVLLNTASTTSVFISSSWFTCSGCDALSSFHFQLALSGGELASVLVGGAATPISMLCTQPTYCNGQNTVSPNTTPYPGTVVAPTIGPHSGMILLGSR